MRLICIIVLLLISILEISPVPITPLLLLYVVIFRPLWFYNLVMKIYG